MYVLIGNGKKGKMYSTTTFMKDDIQTMDSFLQFTIIILKSGLYCKIKLLQFFPHKNS